MASRLPAGPAAHYRRHQYSQVSGSRPFLRSMAPPWRRDDGNYWQSASTN